MHLQIMTSRYFVWIKKIQNIRKDFLIRRTIKRDVQEIKAAVFDIILYEKFIHCLRLLLLVYIHASSLSFYSAQKVREFS